MRLSVKARIALATVIILVANVVTVAVTWAYLSSAASHAAIAQSTSARAQKAAFAAQRVSEFMGEAENLVFSFTLADRPDITSAAYGSLMGADRNGNVAVEAIDGTKAADGAGRKWDDLRLATYTWVDAEAAAANSTLRITRGENGMYRGGVDSNLPSVPSLAGLSRSAMTDAVRRQGDALRNGYLRVYINDAQQAARQAAHAEDLARQRALIAVVALLTLGTLISGVAAVWLYRTIATPLQRARVFADTVAAGEMDAVFAEHTSDEIGVLTRAVENMAHAVAQKVAIMREMAGAVLVTAEGVTASAEHALAQAHCVDGADPEVITHSQAVVERSLVLEDIARQMLEA